MTAPDRDDLDRRILVLAPTARDGAATRDLLAAAGVAVHVCATLDEVCREAGNGAGAALVTAEAVLADRAGGLAGLLRSQPAWSDLPLVVLTPDGPDSPHAIRALEAVGPTTLVRRPVQVSALVSAVRAALRDRQRQYAVRDLLAERDRADDRAAFVREASGVGFWYCDLPFDILEWDERVKRHFHLPPDARVTIDTFYNRIHPDDREPTRAAIGRSIAAREGYDTLYRTVDPASGAERWVRAIGRTFYAPDGSPRRFDGVTLDVTAQRRAEDDLREAHAGAERRVREGTRELRREQTFLKAVLDNIGDGIVACDPAGVLTLFNRATREFHGLPESPVPAGEWARHYSLFRPDGVTPLPADEVPLARALRGERVWDAEMVIAPAGGGRRTVLSSGQPLVDADGNRLGAVVSMRDITDRRGREAAQAQAALERGRADALLRVAQASRTMNSVLNVESIAGVLATEAREILGANVSATSLTAADDPARVSHTVSASAGRGRFDSAATLHPLAAHTTAPVRLTRAEIAAHPLYAAAGAGAPGWPPPAGWLAVPLVGFSGQVLGFVQLSDKEGGEFTEEDEAVLVQLAAIAAAGIQNARLYERLKDQDRRKDEFLATLAHELRNPLAPVRNGLQILRASPAGGAAADRVREMMERQVGHLVHLVDDLLDVSRVTSGKITLKRERVEVRAAVDAAVETSRPLVEAAGHDLSVELPAAPLAVDADKNRLSQVLTNLLNNAAKYTPAGGTIRVRARQDGDVVAVSVADTGVGLPREMLPKIFDMFTQVGASVDRSQGGLGIGLTLVRKLVEMHGGTVAAESPGAGLGSTFTVRLPAAPAPAGAGATPARPRPTPTPAGRRILVVDDNVDGAESLALLLAITGHEVRTAHTGPAGLEVAGAFRPEAVFLDIGLPGMNGYEVAKRLRDDPIHRGVVIVALTGWGADEDRRRSREAGFDYHLTKPAEADKVGEVLAGLPPPRQ